MSFSANYTHGKYLRHHHTKGLRKMKEAKRKPHHKPNKQFFDHLLEERQMSQRQLAKHMGIEPSSLNRALFAKRRFTLEETEKVASILSVPLIVVLENLGIANQAELRQAWVEVVGKNVFLRHVLTQLIAAVEWANEINRKSGGHLITEDNIKRARAAFAPLSKESMRTGFQRVSV